MRAYSSLLLERKPFRFVGQYRMNRVTKEYRQQIISSVLGEQLCPDCTISMLVVVTGLKDLWEKKLNYSNSLKCLHWERCNLCKLSYLGGRGCHSSSSVMFALYIVTNGGPLKRKPHWERGCLIRTELHLSHELYQLNTKIFYSVAYFVHSQDDHTVIRWWIERDTRSNILPFDNCHSYYYILKTNWTNERKLLWTIDLVATFKLYQGYTSENVWLSLKFWENMNLHFIDEWVFRWGFQWVFW